MCVGLHVVEDSEVVQSRGELEIRILKLILEFVFHYHHAVLILQAFRK